MLGCSLDEAFGGIKKKKNLRNNHANILSRSRLNINENQENNRLDNKIIISDEANKKEEEVKKINNEVRDDVLNKLNVVLNRLSDLEDKFNKNQQQALTNQELAGLKAQKANIVHKQITENNNNESNNTANLINRLNRLRNSNRNNSNRNNSNMNNSNNSNMNNSNMNNSNIISNDSIIEGFTNNNISYDGDQLNELLLFGLMGIFILLLFDYIYKLGKKTF